MLIEFSAIINLLPIEDKELSWTHDEIHQYLYHNVFHKENDILNFISIVDNSIERMISKRAKVITQLIKKTFGASSQTCTTGPIYTPLTTGLRFEAKIKV